MAGIYIHIPFCKQACSYCNFHFSTKISNVENFLSALKSEIQLRNSYLDNEEIESIYFGGGTPSLLNKHQLAEIFELLHQEFSVQETVEITLEANPDDLNEEKIKGLKESPINRLSIGVQSFYDKDLKFMNRSHSAEEAKNSILIAKEVGFENINVDLIFGTQTTSNEMWKSNLDTFFELNVPHLSAYSLTIEEKTVLANQIKNRKVEHIDENKNFEQYHILQKAIGNHGFEQYEVSNYCIGDSYSKHNTSYWKSKSYLGLGPSAHSFNGHSRQWNISNNARYIHALGKNHPIFEIEQLSPKDQYNEYLITSLRTIWGVNEKYIELQFPSPIYSHYKSQKSAINFDWINRTENGFALKNAYLFQSDEIVRQLMI